MLWFCRLALNLQSVSYCKLKIGNTVGRWARCVREETIFNNSRLKCNSERDQFNRFHLMEDSGYGVIIITRGCVSCALLLFLRQVVHL